MDLPFTGKHIYQDLHSQSVSSAAAFLSSYIIENFAAEESRVLDLGCGCGIISIMICLCRPRWKVQGIDLQTELIQIARENARLCELEISFEVGDLRDYHSLEQFDLIVSNPPWQKAGTGLLSPHHSKNLSSFELTCELNDVLCAIQRNLRPGGGKAILIYPQERSEEIGEAIQQSGLDIIRSFQQGARKKFIIFEIETRNNK